MYKVIKFILVVLIFVGCKQVYTPYKFGENKNLVFDKEILLKGEKIDINILGVTDIDVKDSMLILSTYNSQKYYNVVSVNSLKILGKFISKGNAGNELIQPSYIIEFITNEVDTRFSVYDYGKQELKFINLSESLTQNKNIIESKTYTFGSNDVTAVYALNNNNFLLRYANLIDNSIHVGIWDANNSKLSSSNCIIRSNKNYDFFQTSSIDCVNNKKQKFASAMMFLDKIVLYDISNPQNTINLSVSEQAASIEEVENTRMPNKIEFYHDIKSTDSLVYALYVNATRKNWAEAEDINTSIHVFDWNGNGIVNVKLDKKIAQIAIDNVNGFIYGLTPTEEIYRFAFNY